MGTNINSISFENFYNYYGSYEANNYVFRSGINIINADNNMGKSKFYNGILWLIEDAVYDSDSKRKEPVSNSVMKMASAKAIKENKPFKMGIKVTFVEDDKKEYTIEKYINFRNLDGKWEHSDSSVDISETLDNCTAQIEVNSISEQNEIINKIIPLELRNYALLQGESMERLVDLSSPAGLSSTIEVLAGISDLTKINEVTKYFSKQANTLYHDKQEENSNNLSQTTVLTEKQKTLEKYIEQQEAKIALWQEEKKKSLSKKEELEALQRNASIRQNFKNQLDNLLSSLNKLKDEKKNFEKNITSKLFDRSTPWLLMGLKTETDRFEDIRTNFIKNKALVESGANCTIILPEGSPDNNSLKRMLEEEKCEVCGRQALKGTKEWQNIEQLYNRQFKQLNTSKNNFNQFYGDLSKSAGSVYSFLDGITDSIEAYHESIKCVDEKISEIKKEIETVTTKYANAGGAGHNDEKDISDFLTAVKDIQEKERLIESGKQQIDTWSKAIKANDKILKTYQKGDKITVFENFKDSMQTIKTIFESTQERIYNEILADLESNANKQYTELTAGNMTSGGVLKFKKQDDNTVQVYIMDEKETTRMTGLGTGFQRMKQLSIIMAIISSKIGNKQFLYPFISDAPFSEFGENFISNFFNVAQNIFSQCIILIKELYDPKDPEFLNSFGKNILQQMKNGSIKGTFYVNIIEDKADATNLVTRNICYKK